MGADRRQFLKYLGLVSATGLFGTRLAAASNVAHTHTKTQESVGVLVDLTLCVGCRLCEHACKKGNGFDPGPVESYDDQSVFRRKRRPAPDSYTVVNAWQDPQNPGEQVYVKANCLHCNQPACVSACIVGALRKSDEGPVTYDAWKCLGCRYCMVACPFQIPAYDYHDPLTPQVRKCQLCHEQLEQGDRPECVKVCPQEAMVFGTRSELLELARERISKHPDQYLEHIYGEHEVGGTSWLYLSGVPFEQIGFLDLPPDAPSEVTEAIQHGIFKYGIPPLALFGLLGGVMHLTKQREVTGCAQPSEREDAPAQQDPHASPDVANNPHCEEPAPVKRPFLTPGVLVLLGLAMIGLFYGVKRLVFGLGGVTNLDQQHAWGLWIAIDVASGVALAAGGFTTAFLAHILHRGKYHAIVRPALLTAMLGYTFVALGVNVDLGRYYNVWHPIIMWQGNSVLFEVGMCVMCYVTVLYFEFAPIICERVKSLGGWPRLRRLAEMADSRLNRVMSLFIIAGCVLSCMHQSSLGSLLVIAPSKLHPLWWTPLSPLLFLLSAIAVGFPMVIFESLLAARSFKIKPEMEVLAPLARFIPWTLGIYLAVKIGDMISRGTWIYLGDGSLQSFCWLIEVLVGVIIPMLVIMNIELRRSPGPLFLAAALVVLGVVFNRVNVFLIGFDPPYATNTYFPTVGEFAVTIGLIATLVLIYRAIVTFLPVISQPIPKGTA